MPLQLPQLDDRQYQELLDDALARIPVYTPEWTNFNRSDPGVTLIEVFAFLTESLIYRGNLIPERNRMRFLQLLGVPLQPGAAARGLVSFSNERGPHEAITLNTGLEVRAGQTPFRTELGLDVLPVEGQFFYKRRVTEDARTLDYYNQLYASLQAGPLQKDDVQLYETVPFPARNGDSVNLGSNEVIGGALWLALLARPDVSLDAARQVVGGRTLTLGLVPALTAEEGQRLAPGGVRDATTGPGLVYEIPQGRTLGTQREPSYKPLEAYGSADLLTTPGVVQLRLPPGAELQLWDDLEPLEAGTGEFPPSLEDTRANDRVLTWIRIRTAALAQFRLLWAGINVAPITQQAEVVNEVLPDGAGQPDQSVTLAKTPVIPRSVRLTVNGEVWEEIDDLLAAGPEIPAPDPRLAPGTPPVKNPRVRVYQLNPEAGEIRFGDGLRGARPPRAAVLRANYAYGVGRAGNVNAGAINNGPALPAGLKVTNPVPTWGGADRESVSAGEKQVTRYLQHRDRLVTAADFKTITRRTPGVEIGRVEVLPVWSPKDNASAPGSAPGAVTLLVIPRYDPQHPDAPEPGAEFLRAICTYLDLRRLVTTEVFLRGPRYRDLWLSVGVQVDAGRSIAEVTQAVKSELLRFLAPLPPASDALCDEADSAGTVVNHCGWPLQTPVVALELQARAARVSGVTAVNPILLTASETAQEQIAMNGLDLPRVAGISVTAGAPMELQQLRGTTTTSTDNTNRKSLPVPVVAEECR